MWSRSPYSTDITEKSRDPLQWQKSNSNCLRGRRKSLLAHITKERNDDRAESDLAKFRNTSNVIRDFVCLFLFLSGCSSRKEMWAPANWGSYLVWEDCFSQGCLFKAYTHTHAHKQNFAYDSVIWDNNMALGVRWLLQKARSGSWVYPQVSWNRINPSTAWGTRNYLPHEREVQKKESRGKAGSREHRQTFTKH
jgi:hypothetical protein